MGKSPAPQAKADLLARRGMNGHRSDRVTCPLERLAFFTRDTETVSGRLHLPHVRDVPLAHWPQLGR